MVLELEEKPLTGHTQNQSGSLSIYKDPDKGIEIEFHEGYPPEIEPLLRKTVWGTDGVLYRVHGYDALIQAHPLASVFVLKVDQRIAAMEFAYPKKISVASRTYESFYISLFIVDNDFQGRGCGKLLNRVVADILRERLGEKGLLYAYVEETNTRSMHIFETQGFQSIGTWHATAFSRLFPKDSRNVLPLPAYRLTEMKSLLSKSYAEHALGDFDLSTEPKQYWICVKNGTVQAGLQAETYRWVVTALPGIAGRVALHVIPHLPGLRDLFNPQDFRFLRIGNLYVKEGAEKAFFELLEAVLVRMRVKTAIGFLDKTSPIYHSLAAFGRFGIMKPLLETPVTVLGYSHHLNEGEISELQHSPLLISPLDI